MVRVPTHRRSALVASIRWALHRYALVWAVAASIAVVGVAQNHQTEISKLRVNVTDIALPVAAVLHAPFNAVNSVVKNFHDLVALRATNEQLMRDNAALRGWQQEALRLRAENARMAALLHAVSTPPVQALTAKVVSESGGAFEQSLLALAGINDGVEVGNVVMGERAVVGRVIELGNKAARILLLSDENSRLPVQLESSGERAIAAGSGSGDMVLKYLADDSVIQPGERVVTSGHGGIFPAGLPVGEVVQVGGEYRVVPLERLSAQQFVRIIDYRVSTDAGR